MTDDVTIDELMAVTVSRLLTSDDRVFVGANLHVPRAGAVLAHLTHAPDMKLSVGLVSTNLLGAPRLEPTKFSTDYRVHRWAEAVVIHNDIFDRPQHVADIFFTGGLQIDQYGNANLIGLKGPDGRMKVRGPGALGTTSMTHYAKRYFIHAHRHDRDTFVPRVDYISSFGHGDGGDHRARLGLDQFNSGPECLISPLGIFDFDTPDHRMRVRSVHPGVSVDDVRDATGFDLVVGADVPTTPLPDAGELDMLRTRIDVEGLLRGEEIA